VMKPIGIVLFSALIFVGGLAGQSKPDPARTENPTDKKDSADKALTGTAVPLGPAVDPNTFQIGPEDVIFVEVWHDQDFTRPHIVRPDGKITLPLVGDVQAGGLTPVQLSKSIAQVLSAIIKDPQVGVSVTQVNSKKYYIQGEMNRSGSFPLAVPTTVMEAISNGGGFKDFANKKKIVILRKGKRIKFNYNDVVKGKNTDQNIYLEPGDYIIVP
jgi:polysaccharide biosynthesis/export protein